MARFKSTLSPRFTFRTCLRRCRKAFRLSHIRCRMFRAIGFLFRICNRGMSRVAIHSDVASSVYCTRTPRSSSNLCTVAAFCFPRHNTEINGGRFGTKVGRTGVDGGMRWGEKRVVGGGIHQQGRLPKNQDRVCIYVYEIYINQTRRAHLGILRLEINHSLLFNMCDVGTSKQSHQSREL